MHVRLSETGKSQSKPSALLHHVGKASVKFTLIFATYTYIQIQKDDGIVTGGNLISILESLSLSHPLYINLALPDRELLQINRVVLNATIIINQNKCKSLQTDLHMRSRGRQ